MKRSTERQQKRAQKRAGEVVVPDIERLPRFTKSKPLEARNQAQSDYIGAIESRQLVFGLGPAGVGKTYVCGAIAAEALLCKEVERIIVTRPAVEAGEELGFIPGEIEQKYAPWIQPFRAVLEERLGPSHVENLIKLGRIEAAPLAYMRGRTFKDAFVILDEAQNVTPRQMQLFLTRIGVGSRVVVNGDESQKDIPGPSGLTDAVSRLGSMKEAAIIRFSARDIVRSGLVQEIVMRYARSPEG
jgi:phosphate starvation-inducible PhoH-like protein